MGLTRVDEPVMPIPLHTRPKILRLRRDGIPAELRSCPHWINWELEYRDEKWTKTPKNARTGRNAAVDDPETWAPFAVASSKSDKLGFVLTGDDDFFFIDIDKARDPATGSVAAWAQPFVDRLHDLTYGELSPSGTGFKFIGRGKLAGEQHVKMMPDGGRIEFFAAKKYTTITGHRLEVSPATLEDCQPLLDALYAEFWPVVASEPHPEGTRPSANGKRPKLSDGDILELASSAENGAKFRRLFYDGSLVDYGDDESSADLGLLCLLAFYTRDISQLEQLFGRSALGQRGKWTDREDYRQRSLAKALELTTEHYTPHTEPLIGGLKAEEFIRRHNNGTAHAPHVDADDNTTGYALTDLGNAERFADQHGKDVRHCPHWNAWLTWDDGRLLRDENSSAYRLSIATVRKIYAEAEAAEDKKERTAIARHAVRSESSSKIDAMLKIASKLPGIPIAPDDLDRDLWLFNVTNGTLNLRTGRLQPHERGDLITKLAPVRFDPDARCPNFLSFLDTVMDGNTELIGFLQRSIGYSLTGITSERVMFILYGEGLNGKSTFLEVVRTIFGDYETRTPTDTLLLKRDSGIPNDIARLKGSRFVTASEAEEGRRLAESKIKELTGSDKLSARFLHGEFFDFQPTFKLWLATNHKPVIRGTDRAIWDRIRLIPFTVRIPEADVDKGLRDKLIVEASGILAWAVQGCRNWLKSGLGEPEEVRGATAAYRAEMDILTGFISDCCTVASNESATARELYFAYTKWCEENGEKPISQTLMGKKLTEHGFDSAKLTGGIRAWLGIGMR